MSGEARLSPADLARLFGAAESDVVRYCEAEIERADLSYVPVIETRRDTIVLEIMRQIDRHALATAGEARQPDWERGWTENLDDLVRRNFDLDALIPKYLVANVPVRLRGDFVLSADGFIRDYTAVFRSWAFHHFLSEASAIYEFGCGSASHLAYLAQAFPKIRLIGLDWSSAAVDIVTRIAGHFGWPLEGRRFDFFDPDPAITFEPGAAVLTFGALEQLGARHDAFLDFLLARKPSVCLHIEPLLELYDDTMLLDYLAIRYHRARNYLSGFVPALCRLRDDGRITIERIHRHQFGGKFADTYSYVVWRPRGSHAR